MTDVGNTNHDFELPVRLAAVFMRQGTVHLAVCETVKQISSSLDNVERDLKHRRPLPVEHVIVHRSMTSRSSYQHVSII